MTPPHTPDRPDHTRAAIEDRVQEQREEPAELTPDEARDLIDRARNAFPVDRVLWLCAIADAAIAWAEVEYGDLSQITTEQMAEARDRLHNAVVRDPSTQAFRERLRGGKDHG